jgi:hypothetical protein
MSASQDASQKFHQYNSDDRQLLVGLLHEYSDKLLEASRVLARQRLYKKELNLFICCLFYFCATFSYLFWNFIIAFIDSSNFSNSLSASFSAYGIARKNLLFIILFTSISIFLVTTMFCRSKWFPFYQDDRIERDAKMIAVRLESAMRLTVEISDRVETNLARKLELDLRIDDASSALDYYYSVVNLKSKSQSKSRKLAS